MRSSNSLTRGLAAMFVVCAGSLMAQTPPSAAAPIADLNQIMRILFFPHSNVLFFTQRFDPAAVKRAPEPSSSTDPLTGVFGGWEAVENSARLMVEGADFLMTPGRKCSNGRDMPTNRPEWVEMVKHLREAGVVALKAAQTKNMERMIDATATLNDSCMECHNRFRPRTIANRCQ